MLLTLPQIESKIREFADIIFAPDEFIPTFGTSNQSGLPHIEIEDGCYKFVVCENGEELVREAFHDPDELLFKVLHDISFSMACDGVLEEAGNQGFKEQFFQSQKNIISKINLFYIEKIKQRQDTITPVDTKELSDTRKKVLLKNNVSKKSSSKG